MMAERVAKCWADPNVELPKISPPSQPPLPAAAPTAPPPAQPQPPSAGSAPPGGGKPEGK
jgi:hypothetical protein